jgi:hypothetical protein
VISRAIAAAVRANAFYKTVGQKGFCFLIIILFRFFCFQLTALVDYFESSQRLDGSWGTGYLIPDVTADVVTGLLDAGYDPNGDVLRRALLYTQLAQNLDGSWTDGAGQESGSLTSQNLAILLRTGAARGDERVGNAVSWLLALQDPASGGFAPTPGWFTTPAATALVLRGLDAYLLAPGPASVPDATVQAAVDRALRHLATRGTARAASGSSAPARTPSSSAPPRAITRPAASRFPPGSRAARSTSWTRWTRAAR